mgnify:FL=1
MGAGNKKGTIYNTPHASKNLLEYWKKKRQEAKAGAESHINYKPCRRRYDCVHYVGMLAAGALYNDPRVFNCPVDCKMYKKRG